MRGGRREEGVSGRLGRPALCHSICSVDSDCGLRIVQANPPPWWRASTAPSSGAGAFDPSDPATLRTVCRSGQDGPGEEPQPVIVAVRRCRRWPPPRQARRASAVQPPGSGVPTRPVPRPAVPGRLPGHGRLGCRRQVLRSVMVRPRGFTLPVLVTGMRGWPAQPGSRSSRVGRAGRKCMRRPGRSVRPACRSGPAGPTPARTVSGSGPGTGPCRGTSRASSSHGMLGAVTGQPAREKRVPGLSRFRPSVGGT
jgi:hypothetical protein